MIVAEIDITPIRDGADAEHFTGALARAVEVLDREGARYQITPFGTVLEGERDQVLRWAAEMHRAVMDAGCDRVLTHIKIDEKRRAAHSLGERVDVLEQRVGHGGGAGQGRGSTPPAGTGRVRA